MFDGRWRHAVDRTTKPVGSVLVRVGITADVLTIFGLAMSVVTAFVVGSGHIVLGILLLFPTGLPDLFDGPVAKVSGARLGPGGVLRLGGRPHLRRLSLRGRGLVPRGPPSRHDGAAALRHLGGDLAHLLPAGQGGTARALGQRWPHGAGRAVHLARPLLHRRRRVAGRLRPRPVGVPRLVVCHRHRAVRQRLEGSRRPTAGGARSGRARRRRHGRHASRPGPLARGTGGLPVADVARGPHPSRRVGRPRRCPASSRPALGTGPRPTGRDALQPIGTDLAGSPRGSAHGAQRPAPVVARFLERDTTPV